MCREFQCSARLPCIPHSPWAKRSEVVNGNRESSVQTTVELQVWRRRNAGEEREHNNKEKWVQRGEYLGAKSQHTHSHTVKTKLRIKVIIKTCVNQIFFI